MVFNKGRLDEPVSFPKSDDEWHSFLKNDFENALTIKRYVENLPETAATFKIKAIDDQLDKPHSNVDHRIVKLTGAWPIPDVFNSGQVATKFVNPNYKHAFHYSDCVVRCNCGAPVIRQRYDSEENMPTYHERHTDDCNKINRIECRMNILKNRKQALKEWYMLGHNMHRARARLGYSTGSNNIGMNEVEDWGLDLRELYQKGRKRLARTLMLLMREYPTGKVAELYGVGKSTCSKIVSEETVSNSKTLYEVRKANKPIPTA